MKQDESDVVALEGFLSASAAKPARAQASVERFVRRGNPYSGRGALLLSQHLARDQPQRREEAIQLAEQAIRFGAGAGALEHLKSLDPATADKYELIEEPIPVPPAALPAPAPAAKEAAPVETDA